MKQIASDWTPERVDATGQLLDLVIERVCSMRPAASVRSLSSKRRLRGASGRGFSQK